MQSFSHLHVLNSHQLCEDHFGFLSLAFLSYDSTLSLNEVGGVSPETPPPKPKQWLVSSRWLTDTDTFNEWACEEDYEVIAMVSVAMSGRTMRSSPW